MRFDASLRHKSSSFFGLILALLLAMLADAATVVYDGGATGTGTALDTAANWSPDGVPVTGSEVLFNTSIVLPAQLTTSTTTNTWGDLIWNSNVTSAITIDSAIATNRNLVLSGGGGSSEAILQGGASGDLILMGTNATSNTLTIGGNAGVGTARLNMALGASGNFNVVNSGATLNILSLLSGNFNLTKTGAGTLTLSGANSFGSATTSFTLSAGTVNVNSATALGASTNTFVINGGTFDNTSGAAITTSNYKQTWNGNFTFTGTNNLTLGTGAISLGTAAGTSRTITVNAGTLAVSGVISNGTTATSVIKDGAGTLTLGGASTFNGGFTVKGGTVIGSSATSFGAAAGTITLGNTTGSANASLLGAGASNFTVASPIVIASGSTGNIFTIGTNNGGTATTTFSGSISLGHDLVVSNGTTLSGVITETGGARTITVNAGTGTVSLNSATAGVLTGGVILNNGRLIVGVANNTGTGPMTINGGLMDTTSTSSGTAATLNNSAYYWNGNFATGGTTGITLATGSVTLGGSIVLTTQAVYTPAFTVNGIGDGGNGYSLTKDGAGVLSITAASTYSGQTILSQGTLNLTSAGSTLASTSALKVMGTLNIGVTSGAGVANRINPAAALTLGGGGIVSLNAGATGPVNSQSFASLSVTAGISQLSTTSVTNAGTFAFTGAGGTVYSRATGGVLRITVGTNTSFTNAPTGSSTIGSGTSDILIGAVMGTTATTTAMTDFVKAAAGAISAPAYGSNVWNSGVNTTVADALAATGSTQSLRFNNAGSLTVTLSGTSTIESGGILVTSNAVGGGSITGGQIQAAAGKDLWAYVSTASTSVQGLKISSLIADNGSSSLTKAGAGVLYLTNDGNTYAGGTYLGEGTLNVTSGGALGTGSLNFTSSATLQAGGTTVDLGTRSVTIAHGQTAFFNTNGSANTITVSGVISGDGGLTKNGAGTLVLGAANTYTGTTAIENGTMKLDFSAASAPLSNIISPDSLFAPGGGSATVVGAYSQTVIVQGKDGAANSQTFGGTYTNVNGYGITGIMINRGMSHVNFVAGAGGTLTVDVGTVSRGYSTDVNANVDFSIGSGVTVLATSLGLSNFATVNGTSWATISGGQLIGLPTASYSTSYSTTGVLDVGIGGTLSANQTSLRFNNNSAATVAPGASVVRTISSGGILVTANVGANTSTISAGTITGYTARDLIIHQNNTEGILQIDASIVDFSARLSALSKDGLGTVVLTAANSYGSITFINEGTLVVLGDATSAFTKTATAAAGSAVLTMSDTSGIVIGQSVTQATALATASTTWTVVAINPGVSVTLSNNAGAALTDGTFSFGNAGALGGGASTTHYIAAGATLQIGNGGTTGSMVTGQTLTNNGTVVINRSNDLVFTNVMSGTGSFEKRGAGNLTLSGSNTFSGDTRIYGGSIILTLAAALQSSTLDYSSYGGSLTFGTAGTPLTAATLGGLEGTQNLALTNAAGTAVTLTVGGNQQDTTYSGVLSGLGGVTKTGGGALTLSGDNTYAGATTMSQGTLNLTGAYSGSGAISNSGGVMNISGSVSGTGTISTSGGVMNLSGAFTNTGTISSSAGILNLTGTFTGTGAVSSSSTGVLNMAGTFTDLPTLTISGSVATLSGSFVRSGAYNNLVGLTVSGGVFNVTGTLGTSAAVPLGQIGFSGNSVTNFSGTEYLSGASTTFRVGDLTSATVNVTAGTLTLGTSSAGLALGRSAATASGFMNISGGSVVINGTSTTVRIGAGYIDTDNSGASVMTLSGTGVFTTGTTTAQFLLGSNLAGNTASSGTFNLDGGTLMTNRIITGGSAGASIFNFNGGTFKATGTAATLATSLTTVNIRNGGAVIDSNGFSMAIAEPLLHSTIGGDNATDGGLTKQGSGTLTLSGANTYTGATTVSGGSLKAGSTSAFGINSAVILANSAGVSLDITGFNTTVGSLSGGGSVILGAATLTTGGDNSSTTYGGVISGTGGSVTKEGTGTLVFTAVNAYTGSTTVNAGNLQVGVAGIGKTGTGTTSINGAGAVLSGTGMVQGATTVSLGQISPGDAGGVSEGTLSFASGLTFNHATASTAVSLTIQGTTTLNETGDRVSIIGILSLDADSNFVVTHGTDWAPTRDQSWTLMDWTGVLTLNGWSADSNLSLPDLSSYGLGWSVSSLLDGSTGGALVVTIVPEPSRTMLLLAALACALMRRRRPAQR